MRKVTVGFALIELFIPTSKNQTLIAFLYTLSFGHLKSTRRQSVEFPRNYHRNMADEGGVVPASHSHIPIFIHGTFL